MLPFMGELIGTMILIVFGGGVVAGAVLRKTKSENGGWIVITVSMGVRGCDGHLYSRAI